MTAPAIDLDSPDFANDVDNDVDQARDNTIWLVIAAILIGSFVPEWDSVPSGGDLSKPDDIIATGPAGRKVRVTYSYTGDNVTTIDVDYDKNLGAGYEQIALGTGTVTYDGSDNWTGTTWA